MPVRRSIARLPHSRDGSPSFSGHVNRMRLIHAAAELACEQSSATVSADAVARSAGVTTAGFFEEFEDVEECLDAGIETGVSRAAELCRRACGDQTPEHPGVVLEGLLEFAELEPELAGLSVRAAVSSRECAARDRDLLASFDAGLGLVRRALAALVAEPGLHQQRLAARAGLRSQLQATRLTDRLLALGLAAADDRGLSATGSGRAFIEFVGVG